MVLAGLAMPAMASDGDALPGLEQSIAKRFPTVESVAPQQFQANLQNEADVIVLDVREKGEFAVSRLAGSQQISPDISKPEFLKRFADKAKGKVFVLYCSVGYRSSKLAARMQDRLRQLGAKGVYNLRGGVFAWHNDAKPLVKGSGEVTKLVHPYSEKWGRYLTHRDLTSYGASSGWSIFK